MKQKTFKQTTTKFFCHEDFKYSETTIIEIGQTEKKSDSKLQTSFRKTLLNRVMITESLMSFYGIIKEPLLFFLVFVDSKLNYLSSQFIDIIK